MRDGAESKTRPSNLPDINLNQSELTRDTIFPYNFFDLPPPSSTPRGPIDTKSFSTRETTGKFVLVKFESNRSKRF
jgi:hypothetical protein